MEFGKVEYRCVVRKNGKTSVGTMHLTLIGIEDKKLLSTKGVRALRLNRIMRLTHEAEEQGCLLSYEDLSALLLTSLSTLKRDISSLDAKGHEVPLKGRRKSLNGRADVAEKLVRGLDGQVMRSELSGAVGGPRG